MSNIDPVSYTHLRAHETGRNLVCRLLLEKIVNNIISSETQSVIITSSNLEDTIIALDIINKYPDLFHTTVGYHPHNAKDFKSEHIDLIDNYCKQKEIVAIGECGLDSVSYTHLTLPTKA